MDKWERFLKAANLEEPDEVPIALIVDSPSLSGFINTTTLKYYLIQEEWQKANLFILNRFPEIVFFPGFWVEYGMLIEPSAFGARLKWKKDGLPFPGPIIKKIEEIDELEDPNPQTDGLMPLALELYEYYQKILESKGYTIKFVASRGPLVTAAHLRGLSRFIADLKLNPEWMHKLIEKTTKLCIKWLKAQLEIINDPIGIFVLDDIPGLLSPKLFEEFGYKSLKNIFQEFSNKIRAFHCDSNTSHILEKLSEVGFQIFNFSHLMDIADVKRRIGNKVCLMGNIPPLEILAKGKPEEVFEASKQCILKAKAGGGYILSAGGGVPCAVPLENIDAMINAVKQYGKYP
jgi:uroporphyrinogen decarboxylase